MSARKSRPKCTKCKSRGNVFPVSYGLCGGEDREECDDYILGGCVREEGRPVWYCRACEHGCLWKMRGGIMSSYAQVVEAGSGLLPGAPAGLLDEVQSKLGVTFPEDFREFLLWRDGGQIADGHFIVFSAGGGLHPMETLLANNSNAPADFPLFAVGRDASNYFGFRKQDMTAYPCPVCFFLHEEDEQDKVAESFRDAVE